MGCPCHVRFAPDSDRIADIAGGPVPARIGSRDSWFKSQSKGYQTRTTRFCGAIPRAIAGRLAIAYEDASAEIELVNSFSAANAGPQTSPPEAPQMPGTMRIAQRTARLCPSPLRTPMQRPERSRLPATRDCGDLSAPEPIAAHSGWQ